jgi:hypothetical protein
MPNIEEGTETRSIANDQNSLFSDPQLLKLSDLVPNGVLAMLPLIAQHQHYR